MSVWIVIPNAGEPAPLLERTLASAEAVYGAAGAYISTGGTLPENLNRGALYAFAQGATHIMWLSTGDTVRAERLSGNVPMDMGQFCLARLNGRGVYPDPEEYEGESVYTDNQFCLSGAVIPRMVWEGIGGMDESLVYCSDWDLAMRVQWYAGWEMLPIVYVDAWEYPGGLTDKGRSDPRRRADRARVSKMARRMRKPPSPGNNRT